MKKRGGQKLRDKDNLKSYLKTADVGVEKWQRKTRNGFCGGRQSLMPALLLKGSGKVFGKMKEEDH